MNLNKKLRIRMKKNWKKIINEKDETEEEALQLKEMDRRLKDINGTAANLLNDINNNRGCREK